MEAMILVRDFFSVLAVLFGIAFMMVIAIPILMIVFGFFYIVISVMLSL
jgi:hypothetical protein